jgi:hypothetical protein
MAVILGDLPCHPISPDISTSTGLMAIPGFCVVHDGRPGQLHRQTVCEARRDGETSKIKNRRTFRGSKTQSNFWRVWEGSTHQPIDFNFGYRSIFLTLGGENLTVRLGGRRLFSEKVRTEWEKNNF